MGEDNELELFVTYPNGEEKPLDKGSLSYTIYLDCSMVGKSIELLRESVNSLITLNAKLSEEAINYLRGRSKSSRKRPYKAKQILKMLQISKINL